PGSGTKGIDRCVRLSGRRCFSVGRRSNSRDERRRAAAAGLRARCPRNGLRRALDVEEARERGPPEIPTRTVIDDLMAVIPVSRKKIEIDGSAAFAPCGCHLLCQLG